MYYDPYLIYGDYDEPILTVQGPMRARRGPGGMGQGGMGGLSRDIGLIDEISEAIIGEVHAYNFYERLVDLTTTPPQRQIILSIQQDEARHYHWFTILLNRLGGQQPSIPAGELPRTFREGVRKAIQDELAAAAFYQEIAGQATSRPVQIRFLHASRDEQRHASLFQNMLRSM